MWKLLKISAVLLVLKTLLVAFSFYILDYHKIQQNLENYLLVHGKNYNVAEYKLKHFPVPYLEISEMTQEGRFRVSHAKIYFSFLSLIIFNPKISFIEVENIYVYPNCQNALSNNSLVQQIFEFLNSDLEVDIKQANFINESGRLMYQINDIHLMSDRVTSIGDLDLKFKGDIEDVAMVFGNITKQAEQVKIALELDDDISSQHLKQISFYQRVIEKLQRMIPQLQEIGEPIVKPDDKRVFEFKFIANNDEKFLKLSNISLDSDYATIKANVAISKTSDIPSVININCNKLNLSKFLEYKFFKNYNDYVSSPKLNISTDPILLNLSIDEVLLQDQKALSNLKFSAEISNNTIVLKQCDGVLEPSGKFSIDGSITGNLVRSIFNGKIYLEHSDLNKILSYLGQSTLAVAAPSPFVLSSNMKLTLVDLALRDLVLKTNDLKVKGAINVRLIGDTPRIFTDITFSALDLDSQYPVISPLLQKATDLTKDTTDASYLAKFIAIRQISSIGEHILNFNSISANGYSWQAILAFNVQPGKIRIDSIHLNKDEQFIESNALLDATGLKPTLNLNIIDGNVIVNSGGMIDSFLNLCSTIKERYDLSKILIKIESDLSKFSYNGITLDDFSISAENDGPLIKLNSLASKVFGGNLNVKGNVLLNPCVVELVYSGSSLTTLDLFNTLPKHFLPITGGELNVNGTLSTKGLSPKELLYNTQLNLVFTGKDLVINNFAIDDIIQRIGYTTYNNPKNLDLDLSNLYRGDSKISNISGGLQMAKGIISLPKVNMTTKYSLTTSAISLNIYDMRVAAMVNSTFQTADSKDFQKAPIKLNLQAKGILGNLEKTLDTSNIKAFLAYRAALK